MNKASTKSNIVHLVHTVCFNKTKANRHFYVNRLQADRNQHQASVQLAVKADTHRVDEEVGVKLLLYNLVCRDSQTTQLNVRIQIYI